jgi:hypothetical protein
MFVFNELIGGFFSNWRSEVDTATNISQGLELDDEVVQAINALSYDYSNHLLSSTKKQPAYYFNEVSKIVNLSNIMQLLNIDKSNCYVAAAETVIFLLSRNKVKFVDNIQKFLYSKGYIPAYKTIIKEDGKKIHCAMYITNSTHNASIYITKN